MVLFGRVDQLGTIATLASWRPRVRIPPRPPNPLSEKRLYQEKLSFLYCFALLDNLKCWKELEDFVRSACVSIQKGVTEGLEIKFLIEFEVAFVIQKETDGLFRILVVSDPGKYAKKGISRIKFKIGKAEANGGRIHFFRE